MVQAFQHGGQLTLAQQQRKAGHNGSVYHVAKDFQLHLLFHPDIIRGEVPGESGTDALVQKCCEQAKCNVFLTCSGKGTEEYIHSVDKPKDMGKSMGLGLLFKTSFAKCCHAPIASSVNQITAQADHLFVSSLPANPIQRWQVGPRSSKISGQ